MTNYFDENESKLEVWDKTSFLKRLMGDETLAQKLLIRYSENIDAELAMLIRAISEADDDATLHLAHKLHGSSNSVGAERVGYIASLLEEKARINDLNKTEALLQRLTQNVTDFKSVVLL